MILFHFKAMAVLSAVALLLVGSHKAGADHPLAIAQPLEGPRASVPGDKGHRGTKFDLTPQSFARFHTLIRPHEHEWRHLKLHWITDVVAARKKAVAEDKPIVFVNHGGAGYNDILGVC